MSAIYVCARCAKVFESDWSDAEAAAELGEKFTGHKVEDCDVVCHDCYTLFMNWFETDEVTQ